MISNCTKPAPRMSDADYKKPRVLSLEGSAQLEVWVESDRGLFAFSFRGRTEVVFEGDALGEAVDFAVALLACYDKFAEEADFEHTAINQVELNSAVAKLFLKFARAGNLPRRVMTSGHPLEEEVSHLAHGDTNEVITVAREVAEATGHFGTATTLSLLE